ncbi:MAG TPA: hypothetical protein DCS15_02595 [Flavobacteriales bacterium]|jgi:TolA-binding protein|nr:tetratricopeptide repeat protein [Salibacteraceae bacterium]HAS35349.1 hypothetical protein [Flavobacteriales bacterium]
MRNLIYSLTFALSLSMISCGGGSEESAPVLTLEELQTSIVTLEEELYQAKTKTKLNMSKAKELMTMYKGFIDNNPTHESLAEMTFKAGELSMGMEEYNQSIEYFERIVKNHSDYEKAPEATYLVAFIYDEYLKEKGKAADNYQRMIELYPNNRLSQDAKASIELLNMSDEDILKMLEQKNS